MTVTSSRQRSFITQWDPQDCSQAPRLRTDFTRLHRQKQYLEKNHESAWIDLEGDVEARHTVSAQTRVCVPARPRDGLATGCERYLRAGFKSILPVCSKGDKLAVPGSMSEEWSGSSIFGNKVEQGTRMSLSTFPRVLSDDDTCKCCSGHPSRMREHLFFFLVCPDDDIEGYLD